MVKNEEMKFSETLDMGLKLLKATIEELEQENKKEIPGNLIFMLYDTYGFPVDIITDVIKDTDITLDLDGYEAAMADQRARSKSSKTFAGVGEAYKTLTSQGIRTVFTGYDELETRSRALLLVKDGKQVSLVTAGDSVEIVTEETPFYAEAGGQAGDAGWIQADKGRVKIHNTIADPSGLRIHQGMVEEGTLTADVELLLTVDKEQRSLTAQNHSATHLLHAALRKVLGNHVKQSGSLVTSERLRFDFTHFSAISREELNAIEENVNAYIRENASVTTTEMTMDEAVKSGATALFEEKYGDRVRVLSMGDFSRELCGGTHTDKTGNIGFFKIVSEGGIASGIRRIEAVTGPRALEYVHQSMALIHDVATAVKSSREDLLSKVQTLVADKKAAEKEVLSLKAKIASKSVDSIDDDIRLINGVKVLAKKVEVENPSQMRDLADKFKLKIGSGVVLLGAESNGKAC